MKIKFRADVLLWSVVIYFFAFQRVITQNWPFFNYADELFAIAIVAVLALKMLSCGFCMKKEELGILLCWIAVCLIGFLSSTLSGLQTNLFLICVDLLSMIKVWLSYYSILLLNRKADFFDRLIVSMAKLGRIFIVIMFLCLVISQFTDIGMMNVSPVYGIIPFRFLFSTPGNFSKLFYFLIPVLTADLYYGVSWYKITMIGLALIVWASTMRSRALAFIAMYLVLVYLLLVRNRKLSKLGVMPRIKKRYVFILAILAFIIGWEKLIFYFTTDTQARSMLLRYGVVIMLEYFPLGAGFGTYGSDIAATHYSPLYTLYGFNAFNGMRPGATNYLNDNYWPMVMGQFGVVGLLLAAWAIYMFTKRVLIDTRSNIYLHLASLMAVGCLLISSIASKSYSEYSSICVFMLLGVFVKKQRAKTPDLNNDAKG